ncbi:MAG: glutamate-5-semialdehyde dehydrogenase [Lachnospiraceae bacterium]|nr:glutamate-5-semialdehyde dehydrogenase [Lachnospiraceae bacterium]
MTDLIAMGKRAVQAKTYLQDITTDQKNNALHIAAIYLLEQADRILEANKLDLKQAVENNMSPAMQDRLTLTRERIKAMAEGLEEVSALPDPVGRTLEEFIRPNGLQIKKVAVSLGVIGIIYESRPNVTADAFALCFKSGNAMILKGGSDALQSNIVITDILREALAKAGLREDILQLIKDTDRQVTSEFMKMKQYVDVLIPRGGAGLIRAVLENATIPVIETGTGNCHIYVDKDADLKKAIPIIMNAKTQRISVCNACESLVIHKDIRASLLPELAKALKTKNVEIRGDELTREILSDCVPATETDFGTEYLDYIISMKTVSGVEEAIAHINQYNTRHSEAILTENKDTAERFLRGVDAACVYVNASTRFTDGFEFGFGAEIGISNQKLHARGPMGLPELTTYKYKIYGNGQIRG